MAGSRGNGLPKDDNSDMNKKSRKGQRSWSLQPFPVKVGLMVKHRSAAGTVVLFLLLSAGGLGAARAQDSLPDLIKRVLPAVVTVVGFNAAGKVIRLGSGVFIDPEGHLITNLHVIKGVARAEVKLSKGEVYPLTAMVAADEKADLVKLAVNLPGGAPHYLTVSGARPEVGERVRGAGQPPGTGTDRDRGAGVGDPHRPGPGGIPANLGPHFSRLQRRPGGEYERPGHRHRHVSGERPEHQFRRARLPDPGPAGRSPPAAAGTGAPRENPCRPAPG